jgi:hypothetical protein
LPIKPHERSTVLGPTAQSSGGSGHPLIGGFGLGDKYIAIGDEGNSFDDAWVNYGAVSTNKWARAMDKDYFPGVAGAALTPSDKPK